MAASSVPMQIRIDPELRRELKIRCVELNVTQTEAITKGILAFIQYGKWWEDDAVEEKEETHA